MRLYTQKTNKKMDTKRWMLLFVMVGVLLATAFAQENEISSVNDVRRDDRREFFKEQVAPVISAERTKLDEVISAEDQIIIDKLRDQMLSHRMLLLELQCEMKASRLQGEAPDEGLMNELDAQRVVIRNTMRDATTIAEKYDAEIDALIENVKEEMETLREERWGVNAPKGRGGNRSGQMPPMGMRSRGPGGPNGLSSVGFLLWDTDRS